MQLVLFCFTLGASLVAALLILGVKKLLEKVQIFMHLHHPLHFRNHAITLLKTFDFHNFVIIFTFEFKILHSISISQKL